jgi:hypothetical protein
MRKLLLLLFCLSGLSFSQTPIVHTGTLPGPDVNAASINQVRYATDFQFLQSPSGTLSIGSNTITIQAVRGINSYSAPPGTIGFNEIHSLYIAGTGTPESVVLTATTCTGLSTGTCSITFTAAHSHSAGYTIATATGGWQEAIDDCIVPPAPYSGPNPQNGCKITGGSFPGNTNYVFHASLDADWPYGVPGVLILDGQGSIVQCATLGTNCIEVGTAISHPAVHPNGVIIENFVVTPLVGMGRTANGTTRAIYDGGQKTVIYNNNIGSADSGNPDAFDYAIYVDGDQQVTIEHNIANNGNGPAMKCDANWCGAFIYGSALNNGTLGRIIDNDLSMNCTGNAIQWLSGNGVTIEGNIIQAWSQYGIEYGPGLQDMADLGGNYFEHSALCVNPDFGVSGYAINAIAYWGQDEFRAAVTDHGGGGAIQFSNTGSNVYAYYVVGTNISSQQTPPFYIGYASSNGSTPVTGLYKPFGATTYAVLRYGPMVGDGTDGVPYGTGNWAVVTGASCSSSPCSFTDNFSPLTSFVVNPAYVPSFAQMPYWQASIFIGHAIGLVPIIYVGPVQRAGPLVANSIPFNGYFYQAEYTLDSAGLGVGPYATYLTVLNVGPTQSGGAATGATGSIISPLSNGNSLIGRTGYYNAGLQALAGSNESLVFQIYDADPTKTLATGGHQRTLEAGDTGIGIDAGPTHMGFQAADFSFYAGHIMDNSHYIGRATASGWTFNNITDSGLTSTALAGTNSSGTLVAGTTIHDLHFAYGTPGGSALSTGILGYQTVPIGCTITGWNIEVDAGTATVKTLKVASGTAIPTLGSNSISTSGVSISSGTVVQSTTLTDFTTTTITAKDVLAADLITTSGVGFINFELVTACSQ